MLSTWTGEGAISHDAIISLSDRVEVNLKLSVATNLIMPNEIAHVNTYILTLIVFEICWQSLNYRCSWLKDIRTRPVGTQTK